MERKFIGEVTTALADLPPLLTIRQTANLLHLSPRRISEIVQDGRLVTTKITRSSGPAGRRLILRSSVERLIVDGMDDSSEKVSDTI